MKIKASILKADEWLRGLLEPGIPPEEPRYDPVHLAQVLVGFLASIGALYWLLWTLLVYQGGLYRKIGGLARLAMGRATLKSLGYEGPWAMGAFEGWLGNVGALAVSISVLVFLHRLYMDAERRAPKMPPPS
jgi:hypothetical protein